MDLVSLIEAGSASLAYLVAAGLVLGALHGLEPGHSKTMMAAFIIAVRGTVGQAVLLGISAAFSHVVVVWVLALIALRYGDELIGERLEPWFMIASGGIVIVIGAFMFAQMRRGRGLMPGARAARPPHGRGPAHDHEHDHSHGHDHARTRGHDDAHARAHAAEIERRFASGRTTVWQTISFGLTGGLIPCPAAITVLILCLHIGQVWLGVGMVAAFSVGLAVMLVVVGSVAALGIGYATSRSSALDRFMRAAPYLSVALVVAIGVYMAWSGWSHLDHAV